MAYDDRELSHADTEALQELLESVPEYAERVTGYPPGPSDALSALISVPSGFDPAGKRVIGLWMGPELVAFADVLLGYPDSSIASVGLVVVRADWQGQGLGRQVHDAVLHRVRRDSSADLMRLGVIETVAAMAEPFVQALGYTPTGHKKPYSYDKLTSTVSIWERPVDPEPGG